MAGKYFLKMIGASRKELDEDWIGTAPHLLNEVRSPKTPSAISRGDLLVYYASGKQKIFAIARVSRNGAEAEFSATKGEEDWPYVLPVQTLLAIPDLRTAPDWSVMGIEPSRIMQKSYVEISKTEYEKGWGALVERTRPKDQ